MQWLGQGTVTGDYFYNIGTSEGLGKEHNVKKDWTNMKRDCYSKTNSYLTLWLIESVNGT